MTSPSRRVVGARVTAAWMLAASLACVTGRARTVRSDDRTRLTSEEIRATTSGRVYTSIFDIIQAERPEWLGLRGVRSMESEDDIVVYLDGIPVGGMEVLRRARPEAVEAVVYLSPTEAQTRFGMGHTYGAILLTTRTRMTRD